jgi:hypothetical protein
MRDIRGNRLDRFDPGNREGSPYLTSIEGDSQHRTGRHRIAIEPARTRCWKSRHVLREDRGRKKALEAESVR